MKNNNKLLERIVKILKKTLKKCKKQGLSKDAILIEFSEEIKKILCYDYSLSEDEKNNAAKMIEELKEKFKNEMN